MCSNKLSSIRYLIGTTPVYIGLFRSLEWNERTKMEEQLFYLTINGLCDFLLVTLSLTASEIRRLISCETHIFPTPTFAQPQISIIKSVVVTWVACGSGDSWRSGWPSSAHLALLTRPSTGSCRTTEPRTSRRSSATGKTCIHAPLAYHRPTHSLSKLTDPTDLKWSLLANEKTNWYSIRIIQGGL